MNNELENILMEGDWPNLRYYPSICLEGMRKPMKNISHDSQSLEKSLNPGHPEYKAGVPIPTLLQHETKEQVCRKIFIHQYHRDTDRMVLRWFVSRVSRISGIACSCGSKGVLL
jgi:hypothetical protein